MRSRRLAVAAVAALVLAEPAAANVLAERRERFLPVWSTGGMVAAEQREAMAAGVATLRRGGNAVDAAVATAFAQAVTLPYAGNLGGGGFLLLWLPGPSPAAGRGCAAAERAVGRGFATAVSFRETAPRAARADAFLASDGTLDRTLATRSLQSTAVPGSVAGLLLAQRCYGRLSRRAVLEPAIELAARGFTVDRALSDSLRAAAPVLGDDPGSRRLFFRTPPAGRAAGGVTTPPATVLQPGDRLRQRELASTLRRIAADGEAGCDDPGNPRSSGLTLRRPTRLPVVVFQKICRPGLMGPISKEASDLIRAWSRGPITVLSGFSADRSFPTTIKKRWHH